MNIYDLFRARVEGRFGLKHYLFAWIISARLFAVPWVVLFTLFGALLAGITNIERAIASCVIVASILLAGHFSNNYKDVELGVDRYIDSIDDAEKVCSTLKPYTAAAWVVPLKITGVRFQKANEAAFIALSIVIYAVFFTSNVTTILTTLPIFTLGIAMAETYTTKFKPRRLGEVAAFLAHGFGTTALGFLSQRPDVLQAIMSGIPTGLLSALVYSVDQFVDMKTDFVKRVRSIYESWFNSRMPLGLYVLIVFVFWFNVVVAWIASGIYPRGTLIIIALIPLILFFSPQLEYDRNKALAKLVLTATFLIPLLLCVGAIIV
ncbi:MAG: hypothetical protein QXT26_06520 [Thermoproteota archaeon]